MLISSLMKHSIATRINQSVLIRSYDTTDIGEHFTPWSVWVTGHSLVAAQTTSKIRFNLFSDIGATKSDESTAFMQSTASDFWTLSW